MARSFKRPAIILGALIFGVAAGMWMFWPGTLPPPDEANRVTHPSGYSLIRPAGFDVRFGRGAAGNHLDNMLVYDPHHISPPPTLAAQRFNGEPDWEELKKRGFTEKGTYQGREALLKIGPSGSGRAMVWNHRVIVKFEGEWFEIGLADPRHFEMKGNSWEPYFESFRYNKVATTAPATQGM